MFDYICIAICFILARNSRQEYRVIAYLLLAEFVAHRVVYLIGDQLLSIPGSFLYMSYGVVELAAIFYLVMYQSHRAIITLILISLLYNALVVSQYSFPVYDFMEKYSVVIGGLDLEFSLYGALMSGVMLLELIYLGMLTAYVANFRRKQGFISASHIDRVFFIRRRNAAWGLP